MNINDEALARIGINPLLYDEDQKERISHYCDKIKGGTMPSSLYPSFESLALECAEIDAQCKNASILIKDLLKVTKEDLEVLLSSCRRESNTFGIAKDAKALDNILFTASIKIQSINESINKALDLVVIPYSSFRRLAEIRNDYRLLIVEASLIFYASRLLGISDEDEYKRLIFEIELSEKDLVSLANELYSDASSYERLLEFDFLSSMDRLTDALDFDHDGQGLDLKSVFEHLRIANGILSEALKI